MKGTEPARQVEKGYKRQRWDTEDTSTAIDLEDKDIVEVEHRSVDKQGNSKKKRNFDWIKAYQWQKGQSGNPAGRPKTKTLKEFAREMLLNMSDDDRVAYLKSLDPELIWKMSEGNPHQTSDTTVEVTMPTPILGGALLPPVKSEELPKEAPSHRVIAPASTKDATE